MCTSYVGYGFFANFIFLGHKQKLRRRNQSFNMLERITLNVILSKKEIYMTNKLSNEKHKTNMASCSSPLKIP